MSLVPIAKVNAAGAAGGLVTVIVWALGAYAHVIVPPDVAAGAAVFVAYVAAYLTPHAAGDCPPEPPVPPEHVTSA
jgi:hypothetical protein